MALFALSEKESKKLKDLQFKYNKIRLQMIEKLDNESLIKEIEKKPCEWQSMRPLSITMKKSSYT